MLLPTSISETTHTRSRISAHMCSQSTCRLAPNIPTHHGAFQESLLSAGKVCLSLLGTWSGDRGESWDSNVSSMLQARCL